MCFKEKTIQKKGIRWFRYGAAAVATLYLTKYETSFSVREHLFMFILIT
jgi:hypothetical protein